jgi:hypothetical protein
MSKIDSINTITLLGAISLLGATAFSAEFFSNNIINNYKSKCYFYKIAKVVSCRLSNGQQGTYQLMNYRHPTYKAKKTLTQSPVSN